MQELLVRPATDVAPVLRRREVASRELTEALLARIEAVNPALNAVVELRGEQALAEAAAADEAAARGGELGPLHGVPMTVKDSFDVAGLHTTWGNPAFEDHVAGTDATVVRRLRRAGAIVVGKTNVAFMLGDFGQTANQLYGVTGNPWDPARTPGGSSGGAAAAVAAGHELPRVRVGPGRLDPHPGQLLRRLRAQAERRRRPPDRVPAARSPCRPERHDLHGGGGPARPVGRRPAGGAGRHRRPRGPGRQGLPVVAVAAAPRAACATSGSGWSSTTTTRPPPARSGPCCRTPWTRSPGPARPWPRAGPAASTRSARPSRSGSTCGCSSPTSSPATTSRRSRRSSATSTGAWPPGPPGAPISTTSTCSSARPASPRPSRMTPGPSRPARSPPPQGERPYGDQAFWVAHASLPGLPAVAAPVGRTPGGLPVGVQVVGPLFEDDTAIGFAGLLGEVAGGYTPPPV